MVTRETWLQIIGKYATKLIEAEYKKLATSFGKDRVIFFDIGTSINISGSETRNLALV
jgi:hypothetical protein